VLQLELQHPAYRGVIFNNENAVRACGCLHTFTLSTVRAQSLRRHR
jgi:hypothetical protein